MAEMLVQMIAHIAKGLAASALAGFAIVGWTAIGSVFLRRREMPDAVYMAACVAIGSSVTSFVLAVLTTRFVPPAVLIFLLILLTATAVRWRMLVPLARGTVEPIIQAARGAWAGKLILSVFGAVLWVQAIAPPRDADAMHYHLAHIRQIINDGSWQPIKEAFYALPFGWSLNFLPFEFLHLPQVAGLLNLCLWWLVLAVLIVTARRMMSAPAVFLVALVFLGQPYALRIFSSAFVDAYAILLVAVIVYLVSRIDELEPRLAALLGFVSWVGLQSRYQLAAVAIASAAVAAFSLIRGRRWRELGWYAIGAGCALVVASPFYVANYLRFGDAFWPLFISAQARAASYFGLVAGTAMSSFSQRLEWSTFHWTIPALLLDMTMFPIPLVVISLIIVAGIFGKRDGRLLAAFGFIYCALWAIFSPRIYPTHIFPLIPLGPVLVASVRSRSNTDQRARRPAWRWLITAVVLALAGGSIALSWDYVRYAAGQSERDFHRFTWYYQTYDWANHNTPRDSRFIVIARSGMSYYLDRRLRTADPWFSGEIDWQKINSGDKLADEMSRRGFDYLIIDDQDWGEFPGGANMLFAVHDAAARGLLVPVHYAREKLYHSRILRTYYESDVYVYRLLKPEILEKSETAKTKA